MTSTFKFGSIPLAGLISIVAMLHSSGAQTQDSAPIQLPKQSAMLDHVLDQNGATGTTRTDAKKLYEALIENNQEKQTVPNESQDIWEPKAFGQPCKEGACKSSPTTTDPSTPGADPASPTSPCGTKSACGPAVGNGGGGNGPKPLPPINPCGATASCGPGVGGYGGIYDEKAVQIILHTNATQLTQPPIASKATHKQ